MIHNRDECYQITIIKLHDSELLLYKEKLEKGHIVLRCCDYHIKFHALHDVVEEYK